MVLIPFLLQLTLRLQLLGRLKLSCSAARATSQSLRSLLFSMTQRVWQVLQVNASCVFTRPM